MKTKQSRDISNILEQAVDAIKKAGADHAEASYSVDQSSVLSVRLNTLEKMSTATSMSIFLAAWVGEKQSTTSLISLSRDDLNDSVAKLMDAIPSKPNNPDGLPPSPEELAKIRHNNRLDLYDPSRQSEERTIEIVRSMEDAALKIGRIQNSRGSTASMSKNMSVSLTSFGGYFYARSTAHSLSVSVIAEENDMMESDYAYSMARHREDLLAPEAIGILAGERAASHLNPQPGKAGNFPVVFHPDVASGLLGHFLSAVHGNSLRSGQTFLGLDDIGGDLFPKGITIQSNPHLRRGIGSSMYNGDGLPTKAETIVESGVLRGFFMGVENARRFNQPRLGGGNITIEPDISYDQMIGGIKDGLYVTSLMGQGINLTNGNYSRSAKGFWIENGQITHPVESMTLAGNLRDMFRNMVAADDLDRFKGSAATPHLRIDGMTLS